MGLPSVSTDPTFSRHHVVVKINHKSGRYRAASMAHALLLLQSLFFLPSVTHEEVDQPLSQYDSDSLEQHMSNLIRQQCLTRIPVTQTGCLELCLTAVVAGLLLTMLFVLSGCGGGSGDGQPSMPASTGSTASLTWDPVPDPSVIAYFVHYGRQSPGHSGSCAYEHSMHVHDDSPAATVTDLEPNTRYHFTVSAYNGQESACSAEVSTVTPPASL